MVVAVLSAHTVHALFLFLSFFFFFNDTATTEIYTLSLHDALPISPRAGSGADARPHARGARGARPPPGRGACRCVSASKRSDRKSTRLNSSHSQISYAVFCLKKKKKSIATTSPRTRVRLRNHTNGH